MRWVALVTLLAFGCATVRVPVSPTDGPADAPGAIAPPLVELWLESADPVPQRDQRLADQQARGALASALLGREIDAEALGAADGVLFVRERAVGLTDARRSQQTWAKVGMVFAVVLVVAVVIIALVGGKGHGGKVKAPSAASPGVPVRVGPMSPSAIGHATHVPRRGVPRGYGPGFPFFFFLDFRLAPQPLVLAPEEPGAPYFGPPPPVGPLADELPPPPQDEDPGAPPPPPPPLELPPLLAPADFNVQERGFFDGPKTALQLDLLDRATGEVLWSRAVAADRDPFDAAEVSKLLDEALAGQEWAR